ncbi:MAG TPA: tetratricopeptide repeat protein [Candidatus Eisenbacteria bacterium]|nr:tetratricopeptide repeat protein [Candidatus Eisenbacteria bacterium]
MDGVTAMDEVKQFSTRDAARILNATEARVRDLARIGGVAPRAARGERPQFSFQELLLLRTTRGLLDAGIPPRRVRRVWSSLRRQLEADLPLTSVRILADGDRAVAWHGNAAWQPDSGQFLLHFDSADLAEASGSAMDLEFAPASPPPQPSQTQPASQASPTPQAAERPVLRVVPRILESGATTVSGTMAGAAHPEILSGAFERTRKPRRAAPPAVSPEQWFHIGCELEETSPVEARHAYLLALDGDPDYADAHINLGRLHHEDQELENAERHYREAIRCAPEEFIGHFNLAVLLEDRGRLDEAVRAYQRALELDPESADAHYNLGLMLESRGLRDEAMRHYMNARRLTKAAKRTRET